MDEGGAREMGEGEGGMGGRGWRVEGGRDGEELGGGSEDGERREGDERGRSSVRVNFVSESSML